MGVDRRWWNPILWALAAIAAAGLIALATFNAYSWQMVAMAVVAVASLGTIILPVLTREREARGVRPWFDRVDGSCPECGYPGDGIEGARCPECGGQIPPGYASVAALRSIHNASGPSECVVCHAVHTDLAPGVACPHCGSRRRKSLSPPVPAAR